MGDPYRQGPLFPNHSAYPSGSIACEPCLFNVLDDPNEFNDVSKDHPDIVSQLTAELDALQKTVWSPFRGPAHSDGLACAVGLGANNGFWGPFLD